MRHWNGKRLAAGVLAVMLLALSNIARAGVVRQLNKEKQKAVLHFKRKVVRDLYEADIITIRMVDSNTIVNVAVIEKRAKKVLVGILPGQDLRSLKEGNEFVFVTDNRKPTYVLWSREPSDLSLADSHNLFLNNLIGYRQIQRGGSAYASEFGLGVAGGGVFRAGDYGGAGVSYDAFLSNIRFANAGKTGKFTQNRTRFFMNLGVSERLAVGADLILQTARFDVLNSEQSDTLGSDYNSNQYGVTVAYEGYNYHWALRWRPRGSLRLRTDIEGESGKDVDTFDLSSLYGFDYYSNNERESATVARVIYYKFENLSGRKKPKLLEQIAFNIGYEDFIHAQRSLMFELEKQAPFIPDQFGWLRNTSTIGLRFGVNSIFARNYQLFTGLDVAYGTDSQEFASGEEIVVEDISEAIVGLFVKFQYLIR